MLSSGFLEITNWAGTMATIQVWGGGSVPRLTLAGKPESLRESQPHNACTGRELRRSVSDSERSVLSRRQAPRGTMRRRCEAEKERVNPARVKVSSSAKREKHEKREKFIGRNVRLASKTVIIPTFEMNGRCKTNKE